MAIEAKHDQRMARPSITMWPDSFSSAIRRRDRPVAATNLQAAARGLAGERARQGEDRPQAQEEREERAVLVLEVAAQRADVDRLAGEARQDRRHGGDEVVHLGWRDSGVANSAAIAR